MPSTVSPIHSFWQDDEPRNYESLSFENKEEIYLWSTNSNKKKQALYHQSTNSDNMTKNRHSTFNPVILTTKKYRLYSQSTDSSKKKTKKQALYQSTKPSKNDQALYLQPTDPNNKDEEPSTVSSVYQFYQGQTSTISSIHKFQKTRRAKHHICNPTILTGRTSKHCIFNLPLLTTRTTKHRVCIFNPLNNKNLTPVLRRIGATPVPSSDCVPFFSLSFFPLFF